MACVQALILLVALQVAPGEAATSPMPASAGVGWSHLVLRARKGLLRGQVDIVARDTSHDEALAALRSWPVGQARLPSEGVIAFETSTRASLRGDSRRSALVDAQGLLQEVTVEGRKRTCRRLGTTGQHRWREQVGRRGTTLLDEKHFDWPAAADDRSIVDAASLLWLATSTRLDAEGSVLRVAVIAKGQRVPVDCVAREREEVESISGGVTRRVSCRRVEIRQAVDQEEAEDMISILGMRGAIDLYLEEGTGLPVELRGAVPHLGRVSAQVVEVAR